MFWHKASTRRIESLEDKVSTLERQMKEATLDYLDLYAKAKRLFGRIAKATEREEADSAAPTGGHVPMIVNGTAVPTAPLTPRQMMIQRQIEEMRKAKAG